MSLDVSFTVMRHTHQTELDGFEFVFHTDVTIHIPGPSRTHHRSVFNSWWCFFPHFLYEFSQHCASVKSGSWSKYLPALRAAVNSLLIIHIPEFLNTVHTETVSTCCGNWVLQKLETDWTFKRTLVIRTFSHFVDVAPRGKCFTDKIYAWLLFKGFLGNVAIMITPVVLKSVEN